MKTKFRVFTALLLALMVLVSVLPLQAAAEIGQSGTATRAEAENTAEAALSVKPMLTPSYTPSASYRSGKYYTQLCNVSLTGNQRTDLVNVARSQLGYHEGNNTSQLHGESSGSSNYTEYGYWYGTQVQGSSSGFYASWCAYFISWCARQAGIPTSIISNATYACAGSDYGDFKNLDFYSRGSYTPKVGDLIFFDWPGDNTHWDHVEIVIGVSSSEVTTLGGNTGDNNVKSRSWSLDHSYIRGYGVPKYTTGSTPSPDPTPTPAPSGGVQDLTNPKNPNKYSTPPSGTYLNVGDSGTYVRWLQACLNQCGYSCDVDGQFGYGTAEALKGFQRAYSLTVDGGFGPECRTKIISVLTVSTPSISSSSVSNGTKVTISGSSGATIFYTTNGSNPTESSNKYNGAFVLSNSATVKAIAMQNCRFNSSVASKSVTVTKHTVTFKDWNGSVLKTQSVFHGGAATAPANPTRTGYTFTGWDKAFNNVTADLVVTAQYSANTYTVTFKDWNGTVLKTQQVQYGGAATAPANPTRVGYTFTGWDKAFTNVTANLVVTAQYSINTYTVTFKDWNGTVLKTQQVQYGGAATAPANPTRTGYTFTGWDKAFTNVTANLVVTAQYSINTYTVTFKDWNGTVLKTQQVQYGGAATAPANPTRTGYTFTGWDKAFTNVTANLVVTAQYVQNEPVSTPVPSDVPQIVVESKTTSAGSTVAVNISIANNPGFVTMGIQVAYDSNLTLLSVSDTGLVPGQMFSTEIENPQPLYWANPTATADCTVNGKIATLTFKVADNAEEGEYHIRVSYDYDNYDIYNQSGEAVQFATVNGTLTVTDVVYGDVNGDGRVNNLDGMVLMRHLAKWPSYPASMISPGADVNADGRINNLDGMILMRHLAKWPAYATLPYSSQKGIVAVRPDNTTFENEPTIVVGNAEAAPGETVRIPIELANNPGVVVMGIMVGYDENLTLLGFEDTGLLPGQLHSTVIENPQPLFWGNTTSGNCTENGVIIYLEFKVADDAAPGTYSITVTYDYENYDIYNYDGEPIEFAIQNGAVTVAAAQPEMHTVTFKDWDGTVLKTQEVQHGGDAEAPADPTRVGYTFTGWDKAFTNITADLVVTAQYEINTYTVTFKDWDGTVLKTQEVQHGGDAEAPADPTRVGYTFTGWDKAFTNITADLVVTAQYEINTYTVTFKDWNGTVLKTQEVQYGGDAEAPADPTRVGYTFTGWDKAFTNITADLVVTAQYEINTYTVTFKDWDGTVLKTQEVQHGGDAEAPADPTRTGYTFTGWDKEFTNITADLVVTAQYEINTYTVTFKDWDGTVLKTQEVQYGGDAEAPADPTRVGYTFTGWDKAFTNITADLVVTAQYSINTYTVTFKDWDGTVLKTQEVQHGGDAEAPADPTRVGYTFTGWDKAFTNITADLVVTAQYEMLGDVDGDGNVSMADALTILRMAMDILPVENQQIADVDGDGFITSMDALLALRFAMHIEQ
ncbi:MAG: InlB B-repeat-containing protein [Christensenellales bacterium]